MTKGLPFLVVAAALVDASGRVLVQQRDAGRLAGLWEFPGGKVEAGETPEAALVRELREELDIKVGDDAMHPMLFTSAPLDERHLVLLLYTVRRWSGEPRPLSASALAWHRPSELADLPMPAPDRPLVDALIAATPER
ncbi:(deoxy)nucleoside triphosphate pyrophosphohydrolase [uncultured Sphingomonas sp.]|uniref:(deoxy)nucleoside triphosphate pyrophosphohydrolase n=1 Tax=uncultured Sphingomonas sp. TaxID=158754 RepID=UPI0035C951A9